MGRVYLKNREVNLLIEAVYNVEDTAGPLSKDHFAVLAKLRTFGLSRKGVRIVPKQDEQKSIEF